MHVKFYDPATGNRTRWHISEERCEALGLNPRAGAAFAILQGDPYRLLVSNDYRNVGSGIVVRDDKGAESTGYTMTPHHKNSHALRIERKKGARGFNLPERWEGEGNIIRKWDGGAIIELVGLSIDFDKPLVQRSLLGAL